MHGGAITGCPPPRRLSRDLLMRGIAYKLQEQVHGGLSKAARRRLSGPGQSLLRDRPHRPGERHQGAPRHTAGARMARPHPCRHRDGKAAFDYDGEAYGSLTAIAQRITGAHCPVLASSACGLQARAHRRRSMAEHRKFTTGEESGHGALRHLHPQILRRRP